MAEIKTGIFAKNVQKRLNRAQEKVLQKLGKADETKDEQFEQVVVNFKRQESEGSRLQREMKAYMAAIKGMQQASINLSESLHEVYEPDWYGKDDVMVIGKDSDALWEDFHNKLVDSTLLNLDGYLQQFPDLKTRVAKRSRKLIDYDSARHHMETLQASGIRNDRKMMKAEEELKKAQKVFDELNVGLQDELPTLWDSRVGFYVSTFKNVTNLEAKFHREISLLCKQLYEVMTKLGEQHSDKMFTIQGAPSDSGPLRLARTPSPPDDDSPPTSPEAGSNHMLRPASPGPPRPKSPNQGPPVPPPPKATPTKEVAQEQIIDLFGGDFLPAPTPSQPNERPGESLLDLDFDAFQPDQSVSPIPQTAVPWDMWSGNEQPVPQAADGAFVADWSADFGSANTNGDGPSAAPDGESAEGDSTEGPAAVPGTGQDAAEACHPADSWAGQEEDPTLAQPLRANEITTAAADEVSGRQLESQTNPNFHFSAVGRNEAERQLEDRCAMGAAVGEGVGARVRGDQAGQEETEGDEAGLGDRRKSTPGLIFTNEHGEQIGSGSEYETAEEWGDVGQGAGWASGDDELTARDNLPVTVAEPTGAATAHQVSIGWAVADAGSAGNDFAADCAQTSAEVQPETVAAERLSETELMENQGLDPCTRETFEREVERDFGSEIAGGFSSDPFTQIPSGGIHMDELQGGGGFTSDAFGQTPGGEGFVADFTTDPFGQTPGGEGFVADFTTDPFAQTTHEGGGGAGWDADPFADGFKASFPDPGSASGDPGAWEEVGTTSGSFPEGQGGLTSPASHTGASEEKAKEANPPRVHKEPESSDMSEDEAANRRYGRLYQDLDTEREEVTNAFNGFSQDGAASAFFADFDKMATVGSPVELAATVGSPVELAATVGSPVELAATEAEITEIPSAEGEKMTSPSETDPLEPALSPEDRTESPLKMPIPSVVIEPASSNEGDDDRDADIISPSTAISDNGMMPENQVTGASGPVPGLPTGFMYKVETMHDFEAANSDELELKRGDVVLVVPTALLEDQDAGWLTGLKESEWLALGAAAQRGLFPENFTQRME